MTYADIHPLLRRQKRKDYTIFILMGVVVLVALMADAAVTPIVEAMEPKQNDYYCENLDNYENGSDPKLQEFCNNL